jgi:hypothetical protein
LAQVVVVAHLAGFVSVLGEVFFLASSSSLDESESELLLLLESELSS